MRSPAHRSTAACAALLTLLAGASTAASCQPRGDGLELPPLRHDVEVPAFDAARAFAHIETQLAFGPRVPGSDGHRRQLAWMHAYLRERADSVLLQHFTHVTRAGDTLALTNVIARFRPDAERRVLLLAHWDTRPTAEADPDPARRDDPIPGANDGASGVAVLLELADVLSRHSPPIGVDILLTDGEDYGPTSADMMLGARHFAANMIAPRPLFGVLVDMVADVEPRFPIEGYSQRHAPSVVDRVWSIAEELGYGSVFTRDVTGFITDDHVPLNEAGLPTANIIDFDFGPGNAYWHTHADDIGNVSAVGLGIVGTVLLHVVFRGA